MNPLRSENLVYTAYDAEKHGDFIFSMHNDPVLWTQTCSQIARPMTNSFHEGVLRHHNNQLLFVVINRVVTETDSKENGQKAVEKLEPVGSLTLGGADMTMAQHRNADIGMNIHKDFQGQGYGTEALNWVIDWAFNYANMHRVGLTVYEWNDGAYRLYKRVGFREEGREREALFNAGRRWDQISMGILVHEWRALRGLDNASG